MSGPQGVWIQNGKLYIADTGYNRVLIYNHIPTTNGVAADVVLGQPNFTTFVQVDITQQNQGATASNMLNPTSVTTRWNAAVRVGPGLQPGADLEYDSHQ